ncbi:hypothetical protein GGR51DRAFT_528220 [Nemania sp. FL0031]|nr:hypothetical protein GGR51DRAFT_528220 [Nemania sp. FL0031]
MRPLTPSLVKGKSSLPDVETLDRLPGAEWFNGEIVLFCMYLADRLPHVRVGFFFNYSPLVLVRAYCRLIDRVVIPWVS